MSIYYPSSSCGGGSIPDYYCNPCLDSSVIEYGRVRSIALIKNTYIATLLANPTSSSVWSTGINNADIIVIYQTQGSYDGGTTAELTGFGDSVTYNGNTTHILTYKDPFAADNCDFYNAIRNSTDYTIALPLHWMQRAGILIVTLAHRFVFPRSTRTASRRNALALSRVA